MSGATALNLVERPGAAAAPAVDEYLYLSGRPTLKKFLRFVKGHAVDPAKEGVLVEEWMAAHEVARRLECEEAGLADDPPMLKLGPEYEPLLTEFLKDPMVRYGFNTVPTDVALVELDRLVVYQGHIDLTFAADLARRVGPKPSPEQIFRLCLAYDHPQPPVRWSRAARSHFVFTSPSNDLRFLGPMRIGPHDFRTEGPNTMVGVVGITVGFGSNFLNAIYADKRLILNNGSHRAYVLRKLGVTHVPCIIQHASTRDELDAVAGSAVNGRPDDYLKQPRPSMLKDYFDPRLHKVMAVHRRIKQVSVRYTVEEFYVPAL